MEAKKYEKTILLWINLFGITNITEMEDLYSGEILCKVLEMIEPEFFTMPINNQNPMEFAINNLENYYSKILEIKFSFDPSILDWNSFKFTKKSEDFLISIIGHIIGVSVNCANKEKFIKKIMELDIEAQYQIKNLLISNELVFTEENSNKNINYIEENNTDIQETESQNDIDHTYESQTKEKMFEIMNELESKIEIYHKELEENKLEMENLKKCIIDLTEQLNKKNEEFRKFYVEKTLNNNDDFESKLEMKDGIINTLKKCMQEDSKKFNNKILNLQTDLDAEKQKNLALPKYEKIISDLKQKLELYKQTEDKLKELNQIKIDSYQKLDTQEKLLNLKIKRISDLEIDLRIKNEECIRLEADNYNLTQDIQLKEAQIIKKEEEIRELLNKSDILISGIHNESIKTSCFINTSPNNNLKTEIKELGESIHSNDFQFSKKRNFETLEKSIINDDKDIKLFRDGRKELIEKINNLEKEIQIKEEIISQLDDKNVKNCLSFEQISNENNQLKNKIIKHKLKCKELQNETIELKNQLREKQMNNIDLITQIKKLSSENEEKEELIREEENKKFKIEINKLEREILISKKINNNLEISKELEIRLLISALFELRIRGINKDNNLELIKKTNRKFYNYLLNSKSNINSNSLKK